MHTLHHIVYVDDISLFSPTGGLIYKFAATALNAAGESLQRKPYRMGDHQFIICSESMAIFSMGIDEANILR